jgi:glycosyltransferase involved in cell wall biosynthesis
VLIGHKLRNVTATDDSAVRFTGYLQEDTLHAILREAQMLIFPSIYEGFGLPVLEAMDIGIPVACSNMASLPEVAGEAAIFFDPFSIDDMAQKIGQIALDSTLQEALRKKGFGNVKRFSWDKTACETLKAYKKVFVS